MNTNSYVPVWRAGRALVTFVHPQHAANCLADQRIPLGKGCCGRQRRIPPLIKGKRVKVTRSALPLDTHLHICVHSADHLSNELGAWRRATRAE